MQSRWACFWNSPFLQVKFTWNRQGLTAGRENHTELLHTAGASDQQQVNIVVFVVVVAINSKHCSPKWGRDEAGKRDVKLKSWAGILISFLKVSCPFFQHVLYRHVFQTTVLLQKADWKDNPWEAVWLGRGQVWPGEPGQSRAPSVPCGIPCLSHAVTALVCRRGFLLSPAQLSPTPLLTCFLQTLGN